MAATASTARQAGGERLMLTVPEAAELLGIKPTLAYEMTARDEMPGQVRIGRRVKVYRPALIAWLERQASHAPTPSASYEIHRRPRRAG